MTTARVEEQPAPNAFVRAVDAGTAVIHRGRRRSRRFDHLVHAGGHYNRAQADMLAAGVTYYVFLALFPVLLLLASIAGFVLDGDKILLSQLTSAIRQAVPGSTGSSLADEVSGAVDSRGLVGVIGLVGFLFVGLGAMDKLRTGMDVVWRGSPEASDVLLDRVKDLLALLGFGAVGVVSLAVTAGTTAASTLVLRGLGLDDVVGVGVLTTLLGLALSLTGDTLVFLWLLKGVPATSFRFRDVLPGALFGAVGFELLKVVGSLYLQIIGGNVTARTLGGFVGLIVWINVVARFAFFTAAWTVTIPRIESRMLAVREAVPPPRASSIRPPAPVPAPEPEPATQLGPAARTTLDPPRPEVGPARASGPGAPPRSGAALVGAGALLGAAGSGLIAVLLGRRRTRRRPAPPRPGIIS